MEAGVKPEELEDDEFSEKLIKKAEEVIFASIDTIERIFKLKSQIQFLLVHCSKKFEERISNFKDCQWLLIKLSFPHRPFNLKRLRMKYLKVFQMLIH